MFFLHRDELMKYKHALPSSVKEEPAFFSSPKALLKLLPKRVSKAEEEILGNLNQHLLNVLEVSSKSSMQQHLLNICMYFRYINKRKRIMI